MLIRRLAGIIPLGVGLSFMGAWWTLSAEANVFFRLFGVFASLPFVGIGLALIFGKAPSAAERLAALQKQVDEVGTITPSGTSTPSQPGKLKCSNCGSSPGQAEVSPHGDVKCDHCSRWYNVHTA